MGPKFTDLLKLARDLGADCLATGHYVRRVEGAAGPEMHRGADPARDQSYFLFATTQAQLDYLRFPLGDLPKPRVRAIAAELGLGVATKPDSQDICFVPDGDYAGPGQEAAPRGGQRAATSSISPGGEARRASRADPLHRRPAPRAGDRRRARAALRRPARCRGQARRRRPARGAGGRRGARSTGSTGSAAFDGALTAKVRSMAKPVAGAMVGDRLVFDAPEYGVAPGQAAVLYSGDRVLGGGWIAATEAALQAA